ncbi:uncharacterized protein BDZ99DRAFT_503476 [Mytilinidion resinicola]|uniref:Mid2 domain-containing protein n=1 Tax=Mytilinidion resinicola TaxID=574789 RepID=A0A6A6Y348_9PEZI|nr:uncharacterized protein BDZ99DRAFT_503476 [Mytilinidion resinicola]KAF2803090.1 hypothetical protein BDZ99DRAFT_503476 [Mytilinidion resinicola]
MGVGDPNGLQWIFPPGNDHKTSDVAANFGPVYVQDAIKIEYTPADQPAQIELACGFSGDAQASVIETRSASRSPYFWNLLKPAGDGNGACHFAFSSASAGNGDYWVYMSAKADHTTIWSNLAVATVGTSSTAVAESSQTSTMVASSAAPTTTSSLLTAAQLAVSSNSKPTTVITSTTVSSITGLALAASSPSAPKASGLVLATNTPAASSVSTSTAAPTTEKKSSSNHAAMGIGVTVAILAIIAFVLGLFLFYKRRSRNNFKSLPDEPTPDTKATVSRPLPTKNVGYGIEMVPQEKGWMYDRYAQATEPVGGNMPPKAVVAPESTVASKNPYSAAMMYQEKPYPQLPESGGQPRAAPAPPPKDTDEIPTQSTQPF